jgi:hypothetical protein
VTTTRNATPSQRRVARARVKSAARDLNHAVVDAGSRIVRAHPWAAAAAGFCVGFAAPFLFRPRSEPEELASEAMEEAAGGLRGVWTEARAAAVQAFACALAVSVDRLVARAVDRNHDACES